MSISSCPQCGKQVTIPSGVGTSTRVRCPLCHSQYTLADALVNMPPLLELVDEDAEDYLDTQPTIPGSLTVPAVDYFPEASTTKPVADSLAGADEPSLDELGLDAPLDLEATSAYQLVDDRDHAHDLDDLTVEEKDTEIEELSGLAQEPVAEAPEDLIEFDAPSAEHEDDVLDFEAATESDDSELPLGELAADEVSLDFGGDMPAADADEAPIQFEDEFTAGSASEDEVLAFDNAEPVGGQEEPSIDFGEPVVGDAEGEELALDFGQPVEAVAPVVSDVVGEGAEEAETDKKGKKKKKKEKKQKVKAAAEDGEPRPKRRLSTVLSATLGGILGLVVALYGILWLGPEYDFVGLGKMLPKAMVPGSSNSRTLVSAQKPTFSLPPTAPPEQPAPELPADQPVPDAAATEPPATEPATEAPASPVDEATAPATEPESAVAADAPAEMPADAPLEAPVETPLASETPPSAEPDQPSLSPPAEADSVPSEAAATTPAPDPLADAPADPASDPFAPADAPAVPSDTPEEMPAETPPAEAVTDAPPAAEPPVAEPPVAEPPAAEPPAEEPSTPPADDPFAPAADPATPAPPAAEPPAADAPAEEMPAPADDPFAESTKKPAPADDPFADSPSPAVPAEPVTPEPVGPVAATAVSPDALAQAIQEAEAADQQMIAAQGTATDADLKRIRSNFYVSMFRMADGATFVQDASNSGQLDAMRQQMDRLVRQLAADPKRKESLKYNAGRWLEFPRRTTPGIILAGKVQSVEPVGKLHEIKLNIGLENAAESIVSVLSANDPGLKGGDEALVLGTIVENPAQQLAGYEGAEPTVVWNGMLLTLPPQ